MSRICQIHECSECPNYVDTEDGDIPFCGVTHTDIPEGSDIPEDCPLEEVQE